MPFDPNPTPDTQTREPTLREFLAFCRSKPAGEEYISSSISTCALAQFGWRLATLGGCKRLGIPVRVYEAAVYEAPATFGALALRLEALSARAGEEVAR